MPTIDLGGNTLKVQDLQTGVTYPGQTGTSLSSTELAFIDGVTAGTVTASKAVVVDANKDVASLRDVTVRNLIVTSSGTIDLDSATATLVSNAATVTKYAVQVTTEALTTAAAGSQALTITLTGVAATDLAFVQPAGGTNTRQMYRYNAVCTTNTITVTVFNMEPTNALNGTLIFNLIVMKA